VAAHQLVFSGLEDVAVVRKISTVSGRAIVPVRREMIITCFVLLFTTVTVAHAVFGCEPVLTVMQPACAEIES
jgi:hypothetical protein